jgi:hypothetical protein
MLRLHWETRNETPHGSGSFRVTVHSEVSGRPLLVAVDHQGVGQDTVYVNEDPREFYLVVDSGDLDWKIVVDEGFPSTTGGARMTERPGAAGP